VSEAYEPDNLLDRISGQETLALHYDHLREREHAIARRRLALDAGGEVLAVGCGSDPGRHLFPAPAWRMTGVDLDERRPRGLVEEGQLDAALAGRAGELDELPDRAFDVVLYRYVLHHVAFQGPLRPAFAEAARLLRPGGALVAIEPGTLHPVGAALACANRLGLGTLVHGTPDDIPLAPRRLLGEAEAAGLVGELHAVTFSWRRLPPGLQRALWRLDAGAGRRPRAARLGHTLMLIARRPG
jgi:SAM-dependent methyltransferase